MKSQQQQGQGSPRDEGAARRHYRAPRLKELGNVRELTQTAAGTSPDGRIGGLG